MPEHFKHRENPRITELLVNLRQHLPEHAAASVPPLLTDLPDPVGAVRRLLEYYRQLPWKPQREDFDGKLIYAALTAFGNSRYLSDTLLNWPELLPWSLDPDNLERTISAGELRSDLGSFVAHADDEGAALLLARFRRKHMLRIAMRDLLSVAPLADIALDLSTLADVTIQGAHDHIRQQLVRRFGRPLCETESGQILCHFAVIALGKLGGSELNFSSDIDLMYIHTGDGHTWGPVITTNQDFTNQLATRLTRLLSMMTSEGFCYRVDLRLRPEGNAGELVIPLTAAANYYFNRARDWELQMLLKARPVAGDLLLGRRFLDTVTPQIYRTTTDFSQIEKLAETRDRMQKQRRPRDGRTLDVKLHPGGIRDVEFLVQCLQRLYGGQDRFLRSGGTMYALHRLREKGYLATRDYGKLFNAYRFLRKVEHRLQLAENKQTHELPRNEEALRRLAFQLGFRRGGESGTALQAAIKAHNGAVSEIYDRVIRSQRPVARRPGARRRVGVAPSHEPDGQRAAPVASSVWRAQLPQLKSVSSRLADSFESLTLRWGNRALEHFLERVVAMPEVLELLSQRLELVPCIRELMEYSPHFAAYSLRFPKDVAEIGLTRETGRYSESEYVTINGWPMHPALEPILGEDRDPDTATSELRQFFRRQMLAIQTRSLYFGEDVFSTLVESSDLAVWILRAAHTLAVREAAASEQEAIKPTCALRVIALGRLGTQEFDLGSDADIVFVIPDSESHRLGLWTSVANRIIGIVSSYTADGQMFSIDPRLRPLGRDGELVQTESQFITYFSGQAESWEALTYMKARTVAGDHEKGKEFLATLQEVLWEGFARREELASLLVRMRKRIEAEQGDSKPLKSGPGGDYDIDFILLYWRLLHAESFYETLNTPQRIEIIRKTDPEYEHDLDVLLRATRILRSVDHAVRVSKGAASHALPPTQWQRELLSELVGRWLPDDAKEQKLEPLIESTRDSVRAIFWSAFESGR